MDLRNWIRNALYEQADVLLFGDSQIYSWPDALFGEHAVKNCGQNGDVATYALRRFKRAVANYKPKKVLIEIGVNDIGHGISVETVAGAIEKMIDTARQRSVQVKLCAVLPVNPEIWHNTSHSVKKIIHLNQLLEGLCRSPEVQFVDFYNALSENDELPERFTTDGLHLNYNGYIHITKYLFETTDMFDSL